MRSRIRNATANMELSPTGASRRQRNRATVSRRCPSIFEAGFIRSGSGNGGDLARRDEVSNAGRGGVEDLDLVRRAWVGQVDALRISLADHTEPSAWKGEGHHVRPLR